MRSFLRLHQDGELVLVNPDQIQAVFPIGSEGKSHAVLFFPDSEDGIHVEETVEDIDRLVALS